MPKSLVYETVNNQVIISMFETVAYQFQFHSEISISNR